MLKENWQNRTIREYFNDSGYLYTRLNVGGYLEGAYVVAADGGCMSVFTVEKLLREGEVNFNDPYDKQWYVVGIDVNWEDTELYDAHNGQLIPPIYAD